MGSSGLEPPTSRLSGARSNLLSYEPVLKSLVIFPEIANRLAFGHLALLLQFPFPPVGASRLEMMGFEPMTPCLQGRCSPN